MQKHITKDELRELPSLSFEGEITVVSKKEQLPNAIRYLQQFNCLGFDTETRPVFSKGVTNTLSLIQLATREKAYLFQVKKTGIPEGLKAILSSRKIKKVGVALSNDEHAIRAIEHCHLNNLIDLQTIAKEKGFNQFSLQNLCGILLKKRISKSQQLSNWDNNILTDAQQSYAATDAWVALLLYDVLKTD